ncbi:hypothetical protein DSM112329_02890 [Paraconexibacter sp. AEG42_29]|uniref:Uncharacterized protein n=1 Tax=Paraconexibacter sp. AEG42_29 TaxID=2997339 RepID=A0AAU7AWN1_9ACTN
MFANGDVAWLNEHADAAINAIADAQRLIVGLDARTMFSDGGYTETPISAWTEAPNEGSDDAIERARGEALDALLLAKSEGTHVLLNWLKERDAIRADGCGEDVR